MQTTIEKQSNAIEVRNARQLERGFESDQPTISTANPHPREIFVDHTVRPVVGPVAKPTGIFSPDCKEFENYRTLRGRVSEIVAQDEAIAQIHAAILEGVPIARTALSHNYNASNFRKLAKAHGEVEAFTKARAESASWKHDTIVELCEGVEGRATMKAVFVVLIERITAQITKLTEAEKAQAAALGMESQGDSPLLANLKSTRQRYIDAEQLLASDDEGRIANRFAPLIAGI